MPKTIEEHMDLVGLNREVGGKPEESLVLGLEEDEIFVATDQQLMRDGNFDAQTL